MRVPAPLYAVAAMLTVQVGAALSTHLFDAVTPAGTVWLRMFIAAVILLAVTRPRLRRLGWPALRGTIILGVATSIMMLAYMEAVARIPLGTTSAIEFLGPLGVAAVRSHRRSAVVWPALAFVGVLGLTQPWKGEQDLVGIGFAVLAAAGWAAYIVLTQRVGAEVDGLQGLALSLATAAVVAAPVGLWPAVSNMTPLIGLESVGLALLVPVVPFSLELLALRRMRVAAFGTFMAIEPGIAAVIGLIVLSQMPDVMQAVGVVLVVLAGIAAQRNPSTNGDPSADGGVLAAAGTGTAPDGVAGGADHQVAQPARLVVAEASE